MVVDSEEEGEEKQYHVQVINTVTHARHRQRPKTPRDNLRSCDDVLVECYVLRSGSGVVFGERCGLVWAGQRASYRSKSGCSTSTSMSEVVELVWTDRGVDLPDWSSVDSGHTSRVNEGIFAGICARVSHGESRPMRDSPSDEDCELSRL